MAFWERERGRSHRAGCFHPSELPPPEWETPLISGARYTTMSLHPEWLNSIHDPGIYPHPVSEIRLMETHISWVILTGDWAYKLKKQVNFGFVDFSTLELRRAACEEEVRLNRRTAPYLYDGVVPLTAEEEGPQFGGSSGHVLEFAVRMRQFAQKDLLVNCLERNELSIELITTLAMAVADLHLRAAIASPESPFGTPDIIAENVQKCLDHLEDESLKSGLQTQLKPLAQWVDSEWRRLTGTFIQRKQQGWVREGHGDLHLGNLVRYRGKPILFDCLEFNSSLRWIDVMSDVAFLVMDLFDKQAPSLGWCVLNKWLEQTGDYEGLRVLKYYLAYRALVRAKVAAIRLGQSGMPPDEEEQQRKHLLSYVILASQLIQPGHAAIILMHGVSGSGKSTVASQLVSSLAAIQIRSDIERKRLMGSQRSSSGPTIASADLYSEAATQKTYLRLQSLARSIVTDGYPVIVDATFSKAADRTEFLKIAQELNVPFLIVACHAPEDVLKQRVTLRQQLGQDASDADVNIVKNQLATVEPLTPAEEKFAIRLDTSSEQLARVIPSIRKAIDPVKS